MACFPVRTKLRVGKQTYSYLDIFEAEPWAVLRSMPANDHSRGLIIALNPDSAGGTRE